MNNSDFSIDSADLSVGEDAFVEPSPGVLQRLFKMVSVAEFFRLIGACALLAALALFMLEGWSAGNDVQRYLKLLGLTGLLTPAARAHSLVTSTRREALRALRPPCAMVWKTGPWSAPPSFSPWKPPGRR